MKKLSLIALAALASLSLAAATKTTNKYGMQLVEKDGTMTIPLAENIKKMYGIDPLTLEDALVPYKAPRISVYERDIKDVKQEEIVYKTNKDGKELKLCVRHAVSPEGKAPVLFYIHGGGWDHGAYDGSLGLTKTLAKKYGVTCVCVEYSLINKENTIMMQDIIDDCKDAVNYVLKNAKALNIDSKRIAFNGSSAGGHLSACMAASFDQTKLLLGFWGPYNLEFMKGLMTKPSRAKALKDLDPEYLKSVSPYYMVKNPVKFASALFQGGLDTTVPAAQCTDFAARLKECGAKVADTFVYPYGTHSISTSMYNEDVNVQAIEYIKKYLLGK